MRGLTHVSHKFKPGDRITNPTLTPSKVVAVFDSLDAMGYDMVRLSDGSNCVQLARQRDWSKVLPPLRAEISTYGGGITSQHWQLRVDGEFIADTCAPHHLALWQRIVDAINGGDCDSHDE